jgi:hypothetical protein
MSDYEKVRISISITELGNKNFIEIEQKRLDFNFTKKPRNIKICIRKNPYSLIIYENGRIILEKPLLE